MRQKGFISLLFEEEEKEDREPCSVSPTTLGSHVLGHASRNLLFPQLFLKERQVPPPWQRRPRPHKDLTSGMFLKTKRVRDSLVHPMFFPAIEEGMCCGVTQGEAERI